MTLSLTYKGFNYVSYYNGAYGNADSLPTLVTTGANSVALASEYGIDVATSTVYADPNFTDSIGPTITEAVADGLTVMVRPLIDFVDKTKSGADYGDWRDTYIPNDVGAFFSSYQNIIVAQATLAQQDGAQLFCIGTELDQLTGPAYYDYWKTLIAAVRQVFTGKLTYSADWNDDTSPWSYGAPAGTGNIATQVSFWNLLDFVGIDEYAPISDAANPTEADLVAGWTQVPTDTTTLAATGDQSLISYYESISTTIGLPVLFTEIGYQNATDGALAQPSSGTGVVDNALQGSLYTAFFDAWQQSGDSALQGAFFWNWDPNVSEVGPGNGVNWSPQGLAAQTAATEGFNAACYRTGTRIATLAGEVAIECLAIGDFVLNAAGIARPIKWIGRRSYDPRFVAGNRAALPILIRAGALADGVPARDLDVSPKHAMGLDGCLIPAEHLVNGTSIVQRTEVAALSYCHIELDSHDLLLAEGAPSESFSDCGNRAMFQNAHEFTGAPGPQWSFCAPRLESGPVLAAIYRRIATRAGLACGTGPLAGRIDAATPAAVRGWALHPDRPNDAVVLQILVDGVVVGETLADRLRGDLRRAGKGTGRCAFVYQFANPMAGEVRVRRKDDQAALAGSPIRLAAGVLLEGRVDTCGAGLVQGWAFDPTTPDVPVTLEILVDGVVAGQATADAYRADLELAGMGTGCCAFRFTGPVGGSVAIRRRGETAIIATYRPPVKALKAMSV